MAASRDNLEWMVQQVRTALAAFYAAGSSPAVRKEAERFLEGFMNSREAWQVADLMLQQTEGASPESLWIAAKTLYSKVRHDYDEIAPVDRLGFRGKILGHLQRHVQGLYSVRVQLSLAIASLAVQMDEWHQPTRELIGMLAGSHPVVLIEILKVIPEECFDKRRTLRDERLQEVCYSQVLDVLKMLSQFFRSTQDSDLQRRVLECALAWLRHGGGHLLRETQLLGEVGLVSDVFGVVGDSEICHICSQVICEVMNMAYRVPERFPTTVQEMARGVFSLWPLYETAVREEDFQVVEAVLRVFLYLGTLSLSEMVECTELGHSILQLITRCSSSPDREGRIIDFWREFCECLCSRPEHVRQATTAAYREQIINMFMSLFASLRYPDGFDAMVPFDQDDHRVLRGSASILVNMLARLYDPNECLLMTLSKTREAFQRFQTDSASWQDLEASLYVFRCLARNLDLNEGRASQEIIPQIMQLMTSLPPHPKLRYTCTLILGRYAPWIDHHPQLVPFALQYIISGMTEPILSAAASKAFRNLAEGCASRLGTNDYYDSLMQFCAGDAFSTIDPDDQLGFIEGCCIIVSALPMENYHSKFERFASTLVNRLIRAANHLQDVDNLKLHLDSVTQLFNFVQIDLQALKDRQLPDPMIGLIVGLWPLLEQIVANFHESEMAMEKTLRMVKYAIRATGSNFPLLNELFTLVLAIYQRQRYSSALYCVSVLIDEFGDVAEYRTGFALVLETLSQETMPLLNRVEAFAEQPHVTEDFFNLMRRALMRCSETVCGLSSLPMIYECALFGMGVDHREAASAVFGFIESALRTCFDTRIPSRSSIETHPHNRARFADIVSVRLDFLVEQLFRSLTHCLNRSKLRDTIDVLRTLLELRAAECRLLFPAKAAVLPDPKTFSRDRFLTQLLSADSPSSQRNLILDFEAAATPSSRLTDEG